MEIREYLRIFLKNWWLIVAITLLSMTITMIVSYAQTPIYQSTATYVTRLNLDVNDEGSTSTAIFGLDTLLSRQRIFVTYCDILTSSTVRQRAYQLVNIDPIAYELADYNVTCVVRPESNVLQVSAQGSIPAIVESLNHAVGLAGMERINQLYSIFPVSPLDEVMLEPNPVSPNYAFNLALSVTLGLAVSVTLTLLLEYLVNPLRDIEAMSIRDVRFNLYNTRYFMERLTQEIERSRLRARPLTLAHLRIVTNEDFDLLPDLVQESLLRAATVIIQNQLRQGDMLAHYRGTVFELLLPETPGDEALEMVSKIHKAITEHYLEAGLYRTNFSMNSGLVESSGGMLEAEEMLDESSKALRKANASGTNNIELTRTTPRPFVFEYEGIALGGDEVSAPQPELVTIGAPGPDEDEKPTTSAFASEDVSTESGRLENWLFEEMRGGGSYHSASDTGTDDSATADADQLTKKPD